MPSSVSLPITKTLDAAQGAVCDLQAAADDARALRHAPEAEPFAAHGQGHSTSVVGDAQKVSRVRPAEGNLDARGVSMAECVGDRLLRHEKELRPGRHRGI